MRGASSDHGNTVDFDEHVLVGEVRERNAGRRRAGPPVVAGAHRRVFPQVLFTLRADVKRVDLDDVLQGNSGDSILIQPALMLRLHAATRV